MEAKDTVMNLSELRKLRYNVWFDDKLRLAMEAQWQAVADTQAEISFREGMKEVVGWIHHNCFEVWDSNCDCDIGILTDKWQAKLEEWGVSKEA